VRLVVQTLIVAASLAVVKSLFNRFFDLPNRYCGDPFSTSSLNKFCTRIEWRNRSLLVSGLFGGTTTWSAATSLCVVGIVISLRGNFVKSHFLF